MLSLLHSFLLLHYVYYMYDVCKTSVVRISHWNVGVKMYVAKYT